MPNGFRSFTDADERFVDDREPGSFNAGDALFLAGGNDTVFAFGGYDVVYAGTPGSPDGNDLVEAEGLGNVIEGGVGDDVIRLQRFAPRGFDPARLDPFQDVNRVNGGEGHDATHGSFANDDLYGGRGDDTIYGYKGDDVISGADGRNLIFAGAGNDSVSEGSGTSGLESGADTIDLGRGDDRFAGGQDLATDTVTLGQGRDIISSSTPNFDLGAYGFTSASADVIRDFEAGVGGDVFDFSGYFLGFYGVPIVTDREPFFRLAAYEGGTLVYVSETDPTPDYGSPIVLPPEQVDLYAAFFLEGVRPEALTADNFFYGAQFTTGFVPAVETIAGIGTAPVFGDQLIA